MRKIRIIRLVAVVAALLAWAPAQDAAAQTAAVQAGEALTPAQKEAVEELIRDYILRHPEIVEEAAGALQRKRDKAERDAVQAALKQNRNELFFDPAAPVGGNVEGDVTVVEFFDYRCPVCKRAHPIVAELMRSDKMIRRVYKEWPILGPDSVRAARAALASRKQGKYLAYHDALMVAPGKLGAGAVFAIAKRVGLDVDRLRRDMNDPGIRRTLSRSFALADALKLNGTPSFVIGDTVLRGARDLATMRHLVAQARKRK